MVWEKSKGRENLEGFLISSVYPVGSDGTPQGEKDKEERPPELPLLSEQLSLDELWDMLGECLKELEESHDQHAVLGELWPAGSGPTPLICSGALLASLIFFLPCHPSFSVVSP